MEEEYHLRGLMRRRITRVVMYVGLFLAGLITTIYPSSLVIDQVGGVVVIFWSVSMMFSSALCAYGSFTDRWIGEYSGIPLLASVLALYGISAITSSVKIDSGPLLAYGVVVLAFASGLAARWKDVSDIKKTSQTHDDDPVRR